MNNLCRIASVISKVSLAKMSRLSEQLEELQLLLSVTVELATSFLKTWDCRVIVDTKMSNIFCHSYCYNSIKLVN